MAPPTLNGAIDMEGNGSIVKTSSSAQQPSRALPGPKMAEGIRKPTTTADDSPQRRAQQPKAWTSNINPITQQPHNSAQSNGAVMPSRSFSHRTAASQDPVVSDKHANDRQMWALGNVTGLVGTIVTRKGESFTGVFAGATTEVNESTFLFKMVRRLSERSKENANGIRDYSDEFIETGFDHSMVFNAGDVADISIENVPTTTSSSQNGSGQGFRIDSNISANFAPRERNLQRWEAPSSTDIDMSLESNGEWDQFKANEERFGLKSDFNEEMYTTKIDRSGPMYRLREIEAERKVREIEGDLSSNSHMREERGLEIEDDGHNEEDKYSGVRRNAPDYPPLQSNQLNKYTPPARRAPYVKSITVGPVDPAIISAQIARPLESTQITEVQPAVKPKDATVVPNAITAEKGLQGPVKDEDKTLTATSMPRKLDTQKVAIGATATENVEVNLLDSFRQFKNTEMMKVQDSRRQRQSVDKAVRLNDLMKFSKNFKLLTPVPVDLVPILAKDKLKQDEIVEKAERNAKTLAAAAKPGKLSVLTDQKPSRALALARYENEAVVPNTDLHNSRGRSGQPTQAPQTSKDRPHNINGSNAPLRSQQGLLSHRLADSHRLHKANMQTMPAPNPLPIQDARQSVIRPSVPGSGVSSPQAMNGMRSPTSATSAKFNVKAMEFKPNPAANAFKPGADPSTASSPRTGVNTRSVSRAPTPSAFFGDRKLIPLSERSSILDNFNSIVFLKEEAKNNPVNKNSGSNGGIREAFRTPPTWNSPKDGEEYRSYKDMFEKARPSNTSTTQHNSPVNPSLAHQHQLPLHLQNGPHGIPQVHTPQQIPHQPQAQSHHYPSGPHHYDDHHMRPSASSSSVYPAPSPRMQHTNMAYPSPMNHHAQLAYGQPMPQYIVGPNGPQPANFRQFSGPQMMAPQGPHLAPVMVQQPSAGAYMTVPQGIPIPFNPQMAMYPGAMPQPYGGPSQPPSGYPSPGRGGHMMMQQGSHQGQPVYMAPSQYGQPVYAQQPPAHMTPMRGGFTSPQPHYAQSPYQQQQYPQQALRTPSNGYAQLGQVHHQHILPQQGPLPSGPVESGEESK
ncbi:hypothetical protein MMC34_006716 [Xylographa carneopallida]|nr:hypothetical protein [Xylographa carneopallida]